MMRTLHQSITNIDARPEHVVLIACSALPMLPDRVDEARRLLRTDIDWDYLIRTARDHSLMPLLYKQLDTHFADVVPSARLTNLKESFQQNSVKNLWLTSEVHRLLGIFKRHDILAVPYKGPILAQTAYRELAARYFGDLDILIRARDFDSARRILLAEKYRTEMSLTKAQWSAYVRYQCECVFSHAQHRVALDLHWGIWISHDILSLERARLWNRLRSIDLAGKSVETLSFEDMLLLLAIHGVSHRWRSLGLIIDVGQLLRLPDALDWDLIQREASRLGVERILWLALRLARDLTGADLPAEISTRVERDDVAKALALKVRRELFLSPSSVPVSQDLSFHLRARERARDRVRCLVAVIATPTQEEISLVSLPHALFPFYRFVRIVRLCAKYVLAGMKRLAAQIRFDKTIKDE